MSTINSKDYWEERFATNNWQNNHGEAQTKFFGEVFIENCPKWIKEEITENKLTIADLGCAEGEISSILKKHLNTNIVGIDFSDSSIETAKKNFPDIEFKVDYIDNLSSTFDVSFISNVLEHFSNPWEIAENIAKNTNNYLIIMVPYEEIDPCDEHFYVFDSNNIKMQIGDFELCSFQAINCINSASLFLGYQSILLYAKNGKNIHGDDIIKNTNIEKIKIESNYVKHSQLLINTLFNEYQITENLSKQIDTLQADLDVQLKLNEDLKSSPNIFESKYDNLYAYSSARDARLLSITNSKSYKLYMNVVNPIIHFLSKTLKKIYRTLKALFTFHFCDLKKEILSPFGKSIVFNKTKKTKKIIHTMSADLKGQKVVFFPPTIDWSMPLLQRPQQLAWAYARKKNVKVIFLTRNSLYDSVDVAVHLSENIWVCNADVFDCDTINKVIDGAKEVIISISWTINKTYLEKVNITKFVYEYIDELKIFHFYGEEMERDHLDMLKNADVTVCTATSLHDQVIDIAKKSIISTNAGDYDFFKKTKLATISPLIAEKIKDYKIVLGYYGALASWFDYELMKQVAKMHPDWLWLLVGVNYDKTLDASGIEDYDNIIYTGPQPYVDLPSFLTAFDIATIPFKINDITLSTSPVKLFEYMAGEKPVLTSKMPECLKYESVKTYSNVEEFCQHVEELNALDKNDPYWSILEKNAKDNTWDAKTDEILDALT